MRQSFEDALGELLAVYSDIDRDELISALELQLMALREESDDDDR